MCWGVPAKVLKVEGFKAYVDFGGGVKREALVAVSDLKDGDYVIVHAGIVISKVPRGSIKGFRSIYGYGGSTG